MKQVSHKIEAFVEIKNKRERRRGNNPEYFIVRMQNHLKLRTVNIYELNIKKK